MYVYNIYILFNINLLINLIFLFYFNIFLILIIYIYIHIYIYITHAHTHTDTHTHTQPLFSPEEGRDIPIAISEPSSMVDSVVSPGLREGPSLISLVRLACLSL